MKDCKYLIFGVLMLLNHFIIDGQTSFLYQKPDEPILSLAEARPAPALLLNEKATLGVLLYRYNYKSIDELSEPEMKLAGIRVNPKTHNSKRDVYYIDMKILDVPSGKQISVKGLPGDARLENFSWSPNESMMAFTNTTSEGVELWVLSVKEAEVRKLSSSEINATTGSVFIWARDSKSILATILPIDRKPLIDSKTSVPTGPAIAENEGQKAQNRTYQDLLKTPNDEANFETLVTSEIKRFYLDGKSEVIKSAAMYFGMSYSPDGNYLMTVELKRPFSYIVPASRFPMDYNISDKNGKFITTFHSSPLIEELPKGFMAVSTGKRNIRWRSDKPATLYWVEALDGGDPDVEVPQRDAVYELAAPFKGNARLMVRTKERFASIAWGNDQIAILNERWWNTRNERTLFFNPSDNTVEPRLFNERSYQDVYSDPGDFQFSKNQFNLSIIEIIDGQVTTIGDGYSPEGKFPFIDRYNLNDFKKERIYQSKEKNRIERIVSNINTQQGLYLVRLESKNDYPNYFIRDIKKNKLSQITFNENPFKILNDAHKEVIKYKRADGVELSGTLYLPIGYDKSKKEKMPMIMWAYPTEYKDKANAGQVTANDNQFTFLNYGSPLYWLTKGYVVLDGASFPIVGEGDREPNDTYVTQLVANAKAAIDAVDALGYIDRNRVAVGGHSYGAFMTANLLTHSDLFAAGIARSGAYNRTLTPFGFQSEERSYWDAPDVYNTMSPFQNADKMKTPILLIHGEEDNNSGTYPMQSERYFNALKGLGATARLVILPKESHGYSARESILHMLWEEDQWLEKYVKNRGK